MTNEIFSIITPDGAQVSVTGTEFNRSKKLLTLNLLSDTLISDEEIERMRIKMADHMPKGVTVLIKVTCRCSAESVTVDFDRSVRLLKQAMVRAYPEDRPVILMSKWQLNDAKTSVVVSLPERFKRCMREPLEYLRRNYSLGLEILLEDSGTDEYTIERLPEFDSSSPEPVKEPVPKGKDGSDAIIIYGNAISPKAKRVAIADVRPDMKTVTIQGHLVPMTEDESKHIPEDRIRRVVADSERGIYIQMYFTRRTSSAEEKKKAAETVSGINSAFKKNGKMDLLIRGRVSVDDRTNEIFIVPIDINAVERNLREDKAERKRVELHLHTNMSEMDALTKTADALGTAARWGHSAMAITDHGVVHAFPIGMDAAKDLGIKLLYGVEGYLVDDCTLISAEDTEGMRFVSVAVIAAKTLSGINLREISARRHDTGEVFHTFVNTGVPIIDDKFLYKYNKEDIADAPSAEDAVKVLCDFIDGYTPVTYTPDEYEGMCHLAASYGVETDLRFIDMKKLIHYMFASPDPKKTTEHIENAFNALDGKASAEDLPPVYADDMTERTKKLFVRICEQFRQSGCTLPLMHGSRANREKKGRSYFHIILIARNRTGLRHMYQMITYSHAESFKYVPLMPRSLFSVHRDGIILGSACERGEFFRAMLAGQSDDELRRIGSWYDYLEIQPVGNNMFMVRNGTAKDVSELQDYNRHVLAIADSLGKMTCATGDVHFLNPEDAIYRAILMHAQHFSDAEEQAPLYFKTTDEMLEEFSYLGEDRAMEVVVDNTNAIADMCEPLTAYLNDQTTYAPVFDGANDELRNMSMKRVHEIYGEELPQIVQDRLDFELNSIIGNGYATLYLMAQRLVHKSNSDGYLVGSRGSVGSSFVAFLAGITEVNPLCAHYVCPECHHSDFEHGSYWCGADMPDKDCPVCGAKYIKYGFDIPFQTFLGFKGDKTPDIDLNFSGEYQPEAHAYTKVMFGDDHSFRAGIISTLKDKTAFGYVKNYCEANGIDASMAEIHRLVMGCAGVKRTTGQHPGGMVVVPPEYIAEDFTPLQYPANKKEGNGLITHFDFHAMHDKLVKLDILGHVDPTALRMMQDMTGLNPQDIPLDDPETRALFSTSEPLGIDLSAVDCDLGTIGIPEYGTPFVRGILKNTRPTTIEELVRLAGLSHGTNVWQGNAEDLVMSGRAGLGDVIGTRDDIMLFLISKGSDPLLAFKTMESVRKGKGLTPEMEENMKKLPLPDWYINSCKLIKYMFPRAHAAAYLTMGFRVAYYKMHYPEVFYAVYFTTRADNFDITYCMGGAEEVLETRKKLEKEVKAAGKSTVTASGESVQKMKDLISILEVVYEMNLRGIEFLPISINESQGTKFVIKDGRILPPFNAISGMGANISLKIVEAREQKGSGFTSIDDFQTRTGAGTSVIDRLRSLGCFDGFAASSQTTLI